MNRILLSLLLIAFTQAQTISEGCVNDLEYVIIEELTGNFATATESCVDVSVGGILPIPSSLEEYELLHSLVDDGTAWLGFEADISEDPITPLSFGIESGEFAANATEFPWGSDQPDGNGVNTKISDGDWESAQASEVLSVVCQRACTQITTAPSDAPTTQLELTENPTKQPTKNPTFPTEQPTDQPTIFPTEQPTENPTVFPTEQPTENPTVFPTEQPTENPTVFPTEQPTENPTVFPTLNPTVQPTENPTKSPTFTESPTGAPTLTPDENALPVGVLAGGVGAAGCVVLSVILLAFTLTRKNNDSSPSMAKVEKPKVDLEKAEEQAIKKSLAVPPQQAPALAPVPAVTPAPTVVPVVDNDVATLDALVAANTPKKALVDEDVATLDALVAANTPKPVIDEDIAALDALVAANTPTPPPVATDPARPESAYLESSELKPEGHRSIFAPSPEFLNKAKTEKAKKKKNQENDDLDI